jgi:hypothetical protein
MDVLLTFVIGFVTFTIGIILTILCGFKLEVLISQISAIFMILPLFQMLFVYFANPSALMDWSSNYVNMFVSQIPEEIIGQLGGLTAQILVSKWKKLF